LVSATIVVLARNYNPSIVSKEWLRAKNVLTAPALNFVHVPAFSSVELADFSLMVDENRLQVAAKNVNVANVAALTDIVRQFVVSLPETPYTGLGFNYGYQVENGADLVEAVVSFDERKLDTLFSTDFRLGLIVSFPFSRFAVKMTVPPPVRDMSRARVDFNFHASIAGPEEAQEILRERSEAQQKAESIMRSLSQS
jgi:hypothetical protein